MKIIDITREMLSAPVYEGDIEPVLKKTCNITDDGYSLAEISMCLHNGTHIDAPSHFIAGGKSVDEISLSQCVGKCIVEDVSNITVEKLNEWFKVGYTRLLIKNGCLDGEAAKAVVDNNFLLVGTDGLSIGNSDIHKLLLFDDIVVLESLDLSEVATGEYSLIVLPLKINHADGSPVRAILLK